MQFQLNFAVIILITNSQQNTKKAVQLNHAVDRAYTTFFVGKSFPHDDPLING